ARPNAVLVFRRIDVRMGQPESRELLSGCEHEAPAYPFARRLVVLENTVIPAQRRKGHMSIWLLILIIVFGTQLTALSGHTPGRLGAPVAEAHGWLTPSALSRASLR